MALTSETADSGAAVRIRLVRCYPHDHACGPVEYPAADALVLPLRGVFVKHHGHRERVVADACHALFFRANEPYRVSHPVPGGDECLVLEPSREALPELECGERYSRLDARLIAARKLLWHRLQRRAGALAAEETALGLLSTIAARAPAWKECGSARSRSRQEEMVVATKVTLAAFPAHDWTLCELAKRVHSSPFHLARTFRRFAGMPLHRYHLLARMSAALDEVLDSARDLTTIGLELGFSSHSHFTATFRRTFGATPSSLRERASAQVSKILTAA
jgi:AraC family transcriptional regulator